jgi:hypothetical protein
MQDRAMLDLADMLAMLLEGQRLLPRSVRDAVHRFAPKPENHLPSTLLFCTPSDAT